MDTLIMIGQCVSIFFFVALFLMFFWWALVKWARKRTGDRHMREIRDKWWKPERREEMSRQDIIKLKRDMALRNVDREELLEMFLKEQEKVSGLSASREEAVELLCRAFDYLPENETKNMVAAFLSGNRSK